MAPNSIAEILPEAVGAVAQSGVRRSVSVASIRSLCEGVWRIERELDLLNARIEGVYYWPLIRSVMFYWLGRKLGLTAPSASLTESSAGRKILFHLKGAVADFGAMPWSRFAEADTVLIPHERKWHRNGQAIDIFSDAVLGDKQFGKFLVLDHAGARGVYAAAASRQVRNRRVINMLGQMRGRLKAARFLPAIRATYRPLNERMRQLLGIDCPLSEWTLACYVSIFVETRGLVRPIFERSGARRLVVVCAPSCLAYVAAAQDAGMTVLEPQHCGITPYHMGYSFPGRPIVPYSPERLLTFGQFWSDSTDLPANMQVTVIGSPNISHYRGLGTAKTPRLAVALSQGQTGQKLFEAVRAAAVLAPDWNFVFRAHPDESAEPFAQQMLKSAPPNVRICGADEDMYTLLCRAEVQIGVASTGLFEGMALGARTIVLAAPGYENMKGAASDIAVVHDGAEIARSLSIAPAAKNVSRYFADAVPSVFAAIENSVRCLPGGVGVHRPC